MDGPRISRRICYTMGRDVGVDTGTSIPKTLLDFPTQLLGSERLPTLPQQLGGHKDLDMDLGRHAYTTFLCRSTPATCKGVMFTFTPSSSTGS